MKARKITFVCLICVSLFLGNFLTAASSKDKSPDKLEWGTPVDGIELSVSAAASQKAEIPEIQLELQNTGDKDITLNLGTILANGKAQLPDSFSLDITDANGKIRSFEFFDGKYAAIAGRVDDYILPLRAGSIYTLKIGLDKFYSSKENLIGSKLPVGKYQINAHFNGDDTNIISSEMIIWHGKLQSNTLAFEK
ncbi:MAG: hypothetical protein ABJA66_16350 [Actinomycetota bacterium]